MSSLRFFLLGFCLIELGGAPILSRAHELQAQAICPKGKEAQCHPSVGFWVQPQSEGIGLCTGALVGPQELLTNTHCVADLPTDCSGRARVYFPAIGALEAQSVNCERVLAASRLLPGVGPDYALVRLQEPVPRPLLRFALNPEFTNEMWVRVPHMTPDKSRWSSDQTVLGVAGTYRCKIAYGSFLSGGSADPQAPVFTLAHCPVIQGNSGSPVLNSAGELVGIAQAGLFPGAEQVIRWLYPKLLTEPLDSLAVFTSSRCMGDLAVALNEGILLPDQGDCRPVLRPEDPTQFSPRLDRYLRPALAPQRRK